MKKMKYKLTTNFGLKIIAFIFAAFLWFIVVNVSKPIKSVTFDDIPVTFANEDIIFQGGNVYQVNGERTVSVVVSAERSVLEQISADDLVATADIKEMDSDLSMIPIHVTIPGFEGKYESADAVPRNISIKIEKSGKKVFSLTVNTTGTPQNGYTTGKMTVDPEQVTITGAESMIEQIDKAQAKVDIEGLSRDVQKEAELVLYDKNGNLMDLNQFGTNLGEDGLTVSIEVLEEKTVPFEINVSGTPAAGYRYNGCSSEPDSIQICGKKDALSSINRITIPASAINIDGAKEKIEVTLDITDYLPEDVSLVEGSSGTVQITVMIEQEDRRTIEFLVSSIRLKNLSDNLTATYEPDAEISLQFSGERELLDVLDISNAVSVDLSEYTNPGTYEVKVDVDLPSGISLVEEKTVKLTLQEKEDTPEEGEEQGQSDNSSENSDEE